MDVDLVSRRFGLDLTAKKALRRHYSPEDEPREGATSLKNADPLPDDRQVEVPGFDRLTAPRIVLKRIEMRKARTNIA